MSKYKKVSVLPIRIVQSNVSSIGPLSERNQPNLSDVGPMFKQRMITFVTFENKRNATECHIGILQHCGTLQHFVAFCGTVAVCSICHSEFARGIRSQQILNFVLKTYNTQFFLVTLENYKYLSYYMDITKVQWG